VTYLSTTVSAPVVQRVLPNPDQTVANHISQYRTTLTSIQANQTVSDLLRSRGYDADAIAGGLLLCRAVQKTIAAHQAAQARQQQAAAALQTAEQAARAGFAGFRKKAQAAFGHQHAALALFGFDDHGLYDRRMFVAVASASYAAVLNNPQYLSALSPRGFDQAALRAEQAKLTALAQAGAAYEAAAAVVERAAVERDSSVKVMDLWWVEFEAASSAALKDHSDSISQLSL
jgi:hypothetical protein